MLIKKEIKVQFIYDTDKKEFVRVIPQTKDSFWIIMNGPNKVVLDDSPMLPDVAILCPNDSDCVTDMGESPKHYHSHKILENHDGTCDLYCPTSRHFYKHIIRVPNKNELICRGCGSII